MATFKEIRGQTIKKYTTNPTDPLEGQMWYNNTTGTLKGRIVSEAWSSGSAMINNMIYNNVVGLQTAAVAFAAGPGGNTQTEEYNGSGWSTGGAMGTARYQCAGFGTQTAAVVTGGDAPPLSPTVRDNTEEYNGTAWTAGNVLGTARYQCTGIGILTAGVAVGGALGPPGLTDATEEYDGTNWTAVNAYPSPAKAVAAGGIQAAAFVAGGQVPAITGLCNNYDGTNWTASGSLNTARKRSGGCGTQPAGLVYGGDTPPNTTATETYDGATWTTSPATLATAKHSVGGAGTSTAALAAGGNPTPVSTLTEEYNRSGSVVTAAAWATGGAMGTARSYLAGMGTQTAALAAGGSSPTPAPGRTYAEEYNGSSWSATNPLTRIGDNWTGCGTQTAGLGVGGYLTPGVSDGSQEYDGTNWTAGGTMSTARYNSGSFGILTAGVTVGGGGASPVGVRIDTTEHYNGSAWTVVPGTLNTARRVVNCCGIQTAGVAVGGNAAGDTIVANVEEYDGSTWTNATAYPAALNGMGVAGTLTAGLSFGGFPGYTTDTFGYDGTSWSTRPALATARAFVAPASAGTSASTLCAGGYTGAVQNITEEFTGETSAANIVTVTTS